MSILEANILPPVLPSDPLFHLEATTVTLRMEDPFELEDALHAFLSESHACVVKRNEAKFSTTFCIFMDYKMCKCKFRIYSCGENTFSVQLQRRNGDRFAFLRTYSQFGRRISSHFGGGVVAQIALLENVEDLPVTHLSSLLEEAYVIALLENVEHLPVTHLSSLLEEASSPNLKCREEAARAFWMLADNPVQVGRLCDFTVVEVLASLLLEGGNFAIGYPATMALVALSRISEGSFFLKGISNRVTLLMQDVPMDKIVVARLKEVFHA